MVSRSRPDIPRRAHRLVVRICKDCDVPPYFWQIDAQGAAGTVDRVTARAMIYGLAAALEFTAQDVDMSPAQWDYSRKLWEGCAESTRAIFVELDQQLEQACQESDEGC